MRIILFCTLTSVMTASILQSCTKPESTVKPTSVNEALLSRADSIPTDSSSLYTDSLGSAPTAVYRKDTPLLHVLARNAQGNLIHRTWNGTSGWSAWENLGGYITTAPAAVSRQSISINVFARSATGTLLHISWSQGLGWSSWEDLGGSIASAPAVVSRDLNSMNILARSFTGTLLHKGWTGGSTGTGWGAWEDLGGFMADAPAAVSRQSISINVFGRSASNTLIHRSWSSGLGWTSWEDLGGNITSAPTVVSPYFAFHEHLCQRYQQQPDAPWLVWRSLWDGLGNLGK